MLEFIKLIYSIHPVKQIYTHSWYMGPRNPSVTWNFVGGGGNGALKLWLLVNLHNTRLSSYYPAVTL